ncbi:hypothetical protein LGH70_03095 [Hymenobacter sp. BT635]|uniref:DUF6799 domain-containing protein n=1 Tax=Hymenobacter nitidus TaxID=2880929 RepID=A0ABS8A9H5_9BACT|nr:DUF6799 domain-containing protein [Hymenobacter nitidus]MCB2376551.1 hypothetical protein [Hymenobacter nitidus]
MHVSFSLPRVLALGCLVVALHTTAPAQSRSSNDGFQRRDGTMYVIRNGVKRPMTHDVHLPNGRTVTHDGFVVARDGKRTELAEGKGCDLNGSVVAVTPGPQGQLLLAAAPRPQSAGADAVNVSYLRQLLEGSGKRRGWGYYKKKGKHGKGKHKKDDD